MSWRGRIALVTGGTRGIGFAICEALVRDGATVYSCGTSAEAPDQVPDGVVAVRCDVANPVDVQRLVGQIEGPRLDLLINNAAVLGPRTALENVDIDTWRHVFAVNVDGPFLVTNACLDLLREGSGAIVNISSSVGRRGRGDWGPYGASKHALEGMTDTWADELGGDGIVAMTVNPGGTATDMRADAFPDEDPDTLPSAREVAEVILAMAARRENGAKLDVRDELPT